MNNEKKNEKETSLEPTLRNGEIITIEDAEDLISIAQRRIGIVSKMIEFALKETNYRDWVNQDGSPYLVHSGAERVGRLFGIKLTNIDTVKVQADDTKGKYYIYKTTGTVALPGKYDSIEAIGTCSQRDKFFAFRKNEWRDTLEIDETNILKASYSNFVVNGITHLLGLRNITWEQLKTAGIDTEKIMKIKYEKGTQKAEATMSKEDLDHRKEIWNICLKLTAGAEEEAKEILKAVTTFETKDGPVFVDDIKRLTSSKWINSTIGRARKKLQDFEDSVPDETQ